MKTVRHLRCSAPSADEILLSGRNAADGEIRTRIASRLTDIGPERLLTDSAEHANQGAEEAARQRLGLRHA